MLVLVFAIRRLVLLVLGKEHMAASTPAPGPSLGPSQVSLLNAHDLLSNLLYSAEFDRLRKVLGPLSSSELASEMQHQKKDEETRGTSSTAGGGCGR